MKGSCRRTALLLTAAAVLSLGSCGDKQQKSSSAEKDSGSSSAAQTQTSQPDSSQADSSTVTAESSEPAKKEDSSSSSKAEQKKKKKKKTTYTSAEGLADAWAEEFSEGGYGQTEELCTKSMRLAVRSYLSTPEEGVTPAKTTVTRSGKDGTSDGRQLIGFELTNESGRFSSQVQLSVKESEGKFYADDVIFLPDKESFKEGIRSLRAGDAAAVICSAAEEYALNHPGGASNGSHKSSEKTKVNSYVKKRLKELTFGELTFDEYILAPDKMRYTFEIKAGSAVSSSVTLTYGDQKLTAGYPTEQEE